MDKPISCQFKELRKASHFNNKLAFNVSATFLEQDLTNYFLCSKCWTVVFPNDQNI